jgi:hypothetical protein
MFVFTVVGGTRYIREWFDGVKNLSTNRPYIIKDEDRSEPLPDDLDVVVKTYRSGKPWKSYERRHDEYISDYSIALGFFTGLEYFMALPYTRAVHIDSDVIIDSNITNLIATMDWDYLQIVTPVIPRERFDDPRAIPMRFWDSTNLGISKKLITDKLSLFRELTKDPYPVDIKIHSIIRSLQPTNWKTIEWQHIAHYIRGRKVFLFEAL